jgi:hypothetical protein
VAAGVGVTQPTGLSCGLPAIRGGIEQGCHEQTEAVEIVCGQVGEQTGQDVFSNSQCSVGESCACRFQSNQSSPPV